MVAAEKDKYGQDYRHFDSIIWQLPAWASAVFAFTLVGCGQIISNDSNLGLVLGVSSKTLLIIFMYMVSFIFLLLFYVLYRFRLHQATLVAPVRVGGKLFGIFGGQLALQLIIAIEGSSLGCAATWLLCKGCWWRWVLVVAVLLFVITEGIIYFTKKAR